MKRVQRICLLLSAIALASCTEQVADELKNNTSSLDGSSGDGGSSTASTAAVMRLDHSMEDGSSYYMHKFGSSADCELRSETGFNASTYTKTSTTQVIDCVLDAQEMDLYYKGAKFKLTVENNACEYIQYTPFKYVEAQYGNTSETVYEVSCDDNTCDPNLKCGRIFDTYNNIGGDYDTALSGEMTDGLKCKFDYSGRDGADGEYGKNCDEGQINVYQVTLKNGRVEDTTDADGDGDVEDLVCPHIIAGHVGYDAQVESFATEEPCKGDHLNCMGGPSVDLLGAVNAHQTGPADDLEIYEAEYEIAAPFFREDVETFNNFDNNMYIANFSRICANDTDVKIEDGSFTGYSAVAFKGSDYEELSEDYKTLVTGLVSDDTGPIDYIPMAENPWRAKDFTSPYYAFRCLDQARDTKAQIRLFIRDWDRQFTTSTASLNIVTDGFNGVNALMDNPGTNTAGDDWNNIKDWDDFFGDQKVWTTNSCNVSADPFSDQSLGGYSGFSSALFPGKL